MTRYSIPEPANHHDQVAGQHRREQTEAVRDGADQEVGDDLDRNNDRKDVARDSGGHGGQLEVAQPFFLTPMTIQVMYTMPAST